MKENAETDYAEGNKQRCAGMVCESSFSRSTEENVSRYTIL